MAEYNAILRNALLTALAIGLLTLGLASLLALILFRHVTLPIARLTEAADRMASGDLESPLPSGGVRELQSLSHSFGRMRKELKRQIEALYAAEQKYRSLVDNSQSVIFMIAPDGMLSFVSPSIRTLLGYEPEAVAGKRFIQLIHAEDAPVFARLLNLTAESAAVQPALEYRAVHQDGSIRWHRSVITPVFDTRRNLEMFVGNAVDITDRKKTEESLRVSEIKYRTLFEGLPLGVTISDINGNIIETNIAAENLLGLSREGFLGRKIDSGEWRIVRKDGSPMPAEEYASTRALKEHCLVENVGMGIVKEDDAVTWLNVTATPLPLEGYGVVIAYNDVTASRLAEAESEKLNRQINQMQKLESLGLLAGGIAHDFNNLLGGMFGYVEVALENITEGRPDQARRHLQKAFGVFERTKALTSQLLTFAKGGAPIRAIVDLKPLLLTGAQFALSGSNATCNYDIDKELWSCSCDVNQIGQVIDNIVINAQQAMPSGGEILIRAKNVCLEPGGAGAARQGGDFVKISIHDHGIGIPTELLTKIFDPFFTTKKNGHGLGLSVVYSIINRHGGWIDVESDPGKGTVFHVFLPASPIVHSLAENKKSAVHRGSGVVLIMDDEEIMCDIESALLKNIGYDVIVAKEGREALTYFTEGQARGKGVVFSILDLTIPNGMGGVETLKAMRRIDEKATVFVASGYADDPIMANPQAYGFTGKIVKPFRKAELEELLEAHRDALDRAGA
jgi:two-component system cell cycle sensor histidine kinase/response regulator CckA